MDAFIYFPWLYPTLVTIFGVIVGSFLNVVIYRLPKIMEQEWLAECTESFPDFMNAPPVSERLTLSHPRSTCPKCKTPLRVIDNIPIFSWLALRGRCAHCDNSISFRYPFIELLTASMSLIIAIHFGMSYFSIALLFFTFTLIAATFIDIDTMLLPDQLTLPLMWAGILLALLNISPVSLIDSVIGAMVGYLSLWSIYWGFKLATGKEGMGYGDFKLYAALGAWLGWQHLPIIILISSVLGIFFGIIQLYLQRKGIDKPFPFGPYLAIAGWISALWGDRIINWYLYSFIGL